MMTDNREGFGAAGGDREETAATEPVDWIALNRGQGGAVEGAMDADIQRARAAAAARLTQAARRPSGNGLIATGIIFAIFGLIAAVIAALTPFVQDPGIAPVGSYYAGVQPTYNAWKYPVLWLGSAAVSLGVLLWSLGQIVRAIYFLPGREVTVGEIEA